jgi:hypothetical protein
MTADHLATLLMRGVMKKLQISDFDSTKKHGPTLTLRARRPSFDNLPFCYPCGEGGVEAR